MRISFALLAVVVVVLLCESATDTPHDGRISLTTDKEYSVWAGIIGAGS